ncbi:hypothetical protein BH09ACT13_BH09ACT13_08440 [soil metagenome]
MYARLATFENADMSQIDELIAGIDERSSGTPEVPDIKRILMLLDREGSSTMGITFFETEDALRAAEPAFERMGNEIPEEKRGKRTSVEIYEVAIDEIADGAKAARVSSLEGAPEGIDEGISFIKEQILPQVGDITGWRGLVALIDRTSGKTKTITLWDGPESLAASEDRANTLRSEAAAALNEQIVGVERYEVALSKSLVATLA